MEEEYFYSLLKSMIALARRDIARRGEYAEDAHQFLAWCEHELRWYLEDIQALEGVRKGEK